MMEHLGWIEPHELVDHLMTRHGYKRTELPAYLVHIREAGHQRLHDDVQKDEVDHDHNYVTETGRVLTEEDIQALADEAERGYDVSLLKDRPQRVRKNP